MTGAAGSPEVPRQVYRVAAIEDEWLTRDALANLQDPAFRMVAAYSSVEAFLQDRPQVDVVILDLWLRLQTGPKAPAKGQRAIESLVSFGYKVLIFTAEQRRAVLARLLHAGAHGVVTKLESPNVLATAVARVGAGEPVLTTSLSGLVELFERERVIPALSPQHVRVLQARARGESNQKIANRLGIAEGTVEKYTTDNNKAFLTFLQSVPMEDLDPRASHSAAVIAKALGIASGDLLDPDAPRPD